MTIILHAYVKATQNPVVSVSRVEYVSPKVCRIYQPIKQKSDPKACITGVIYWADIKEILP